MKLRKLRRFFAGRAQPRQEGVFTGQIRRFTMAQTTICAFYAFALYFMVSTVLSEAAKLANHPPATPLWPLAWMHGLDPSLAVRALGAFAGVSLLAAALAPGWRSARVAGFLALLEFAALKNSYGKIGHSLHLMVWVAFVLVALPAGWTRPGTRAIRQQTLLVFWACQAVILMSYTMSGIGKIGGAIYQIAIGEPSAFSPGGVGGHIAERLLQTHSQSALGAWIVAHPYLVWPLMPGAIFLEFFSFWIAFRPALQRPWAGALIVLHVSIYLAMTINFAQNCLLLALFFFQSPFEPPSCTLADRARALPFGDFLLHVSRVIGRRFGFHRDLTTTGSREKRRW